MVKKILLTLAIICLVSLSGCSGSLWAYTDQDADVLGGRAGLTYDRFEVGAQNFRDPYDDANGEWTTYAIGYLDPEAELTPYVGVVTTDEMDFDEYTSYMLGIKWGIMFVEYEEENTYGNTDNFLCGIRIPWGD